MGSDTTRAAADATPTAPGETGFRPIEAGDRQRLLEIAAQLWEGHDYLPHVFDRWVADRGHYFAGLLLDGRLVGCGRLMPMDSRRGWLEALRVDPGLQGLGLGRLLSHHMAGAGRERGFEQLVFSTYFGNLASIRINEDLGFRRTAAFTSLDLDLKTLDPAGAPGLRETAAQVACEPGLPAHPETMANDWTFLPGDLAGRERYFPGAETIRRGDCRIVVADSIKFPSRCLDICWIDAPGGMVDTACVRYAVAKALGLGRVTMHVMVPPHVPLAPFLEAGFRYYEQPCDVYLYQVDVAALRLRGAR